MNKKNRAATARERRSVRRRTQAGITLIEMLVVMTIIALFVALVAPNVLKHGDTARITAARAQIHNFQTALGSYKLDTGTFPTTEQGLQALRVKPGPLVLFARFHAQSACSRDSRFLPFLPESIAFDCVPPPIR